MMDWHELAIAALSLSVGMLGWFLRHLHAQNGALTADLNAMRREVSEMSLRVVREFVHKTELAEIKAEIRAEFERFNSTMERLFDKLDTKADK
jgi:hypothetical protein